MAEGTLRIHFTATDLARTQVAKAPNPLWEMVFSRLRLDDPNPPAFQRSWLAQVRRDRTKLAPGIRVLATLCPRGPYFPDFLTPPEGGDGLDAALWAIMRTPKRRLDDELNRLAAWWPLPRWTRSLGDSRALTTLSRILRAYHDIAIAPYQSLTTPRIEAEHANRQSQTGETLLLGMAPLMRWQPPVLEVPYRVSRELHLDGRGLLLVPSFFCRHTPVALADADLPPTLVYPLTPRAQWDTTAGQPLTALLGTTRATILTAIDSGTTTTELARRVGTSLASASRHTQVLREAGLVATTRHGKAVRHTLTPLGIALLEGTSSPA
jgi:DNA-binding transcriptional ArsR family regulator